MAEQTEFMTINVFYKKAYAASKHLDAIMLTQQYDTLTTLVGKGYKLLKRDKIKSYKELWQLVSSMPESVFLARWKTTRPVSIKKRN